MPSSPGLPAAAAPRPAPHYGPACGGSRPGGAAVGQLVDRRAAGLARPRPAGRKVTIWVDETSLHVLLDGARIKTLPSRLGVAELARLAAGGARPAGPSPLPAGDRHGRRDRAHGQRHRPGRPGRRPGQRRLPAGRAAGHAADGRHPDGGHHQRRGTGAHHALPGSRRRPVPAARRPEGRASPAPARWPGDRAAAGLLPRRHHGRHPEDPGRPDPRGQDRHRHRRGPRTSGSSSTGSRCRGAPHHHQRDPPVQGLRTGAPAPPGRR